MNMGNHYYSRKRADTGITKGQYGILVWLAVAIFCSLVYILKGIAWLFRVWRK